MTDTKPFLHKAPLVFPIYLPYIWPLPQTHLTPNEKFTIVPIGTIVAKYSPHCPIRAVTSIFITFINILNLPLPPSPSIFALVNEIRMVADARGGHDYGSKVHVRPGE